MPRNRHDVFAKQHFAALLESVGEVFTSHKIGSKIREGDLWFIPAANTDGDRRALGLLGQMLNRRSVFDPFRNAASIESSQPVPPEYSTDNASRPTFYMSTEIVESIEA
jgi:hypothetical protein